jgi:hypothetical protein
MKAPLLFSLIPAVIGLHVLLATKFGVYDRHTIFPAVVILPVLGALAALLRSSPSTSLWILNITGWCLALGFLWWTQSYSTYDRSTEPSIGSIVVDTDSPMVLIDSRGESFDLSAAIKSKQATLLLFYRGYW